MLNESHKNLIFSKINIIEENQNYSRTVVLVCIRKFDNNILDFFFFNILKR
jgi:hypothetical protein